MKKYLIFIILAVLSMLFFVLKTPLKAFANNILNYSPCDMPLTYRIGQIDPKYNISTDQFLTDLTEAENVWEGSTGKNLFEYDPSGDIEINLVYDQRSFLSTQITDLDSKVKEQQDSLDPKIEDYKKRAEEFRSKIQQLNADIDYWNNKGGAPPDEYEKLKSRQKNLQEEAKSLQQEAVSLNQSADLYNSQVGQLHEAVDSFNTQLQYKPEEGEYIYDNGVQTINIYFDNSKAELIHTLAHELGHARGAVHNNNQLSIMYPKTTKASIPTQDDLDSLNKACEKKNIVLAQFEKLGLIIRGIILKYT